MLTPAGQPAVGAHVFLDAWDRSEEGAVYLVTDAQGRFAVPTQESTLAVSLPGRPCQCGSPTCDCVEFFVGVVNGEVDDAPESMLYLDAAQETPTVELRLVDLKMRGRVVDATSGQPVAGADVAWHKREEWMDRTSAKTDAQGEFVLPAMLDGYDVPNLTVTAAEGYAPVQVKVDLTQSPVVEIRLPGVRAVEGRVVDEGGRPVPDAQVRVWGDHQIRQQAGKPNSLEWVHNRLGKTDSLGRFTVGDFPDSVPVQFSVGATKDGFSEESVEVALRPGSPDVPVEIVLRSGGTFSGRVLDERGALVDGCRISEMPWGSRTKTYSDGGFSFDGLRRGTTYRFRFTAQGLQSRVVEVHPPAKLDVILRPAAAQIRVDPVDEDGKEVGSNFMVRAYAQGQVDRDVLLRHGAFVASPEALYMDEDSLDGIEALASDGDNSSGFTLDLPQGVYDLLVFRKCWSPDPRGAYRVLALPGVASGETKRVAIPEEKRVELDAQILAAEDGAPLPNYSYRLYDQTGAIVANARSNGQAALGELRLADSGTLTLEFTADGRRPEVRRVQLGAGIDTDLGEVRLARGGARVRVRFLGDSTLRPGVLVAYDDPGTGLRRGRFVDDFAGGVDFWTSPGRLTVFARAYEQDTDARRPRRITLDAVEGETREVVIDLR